MSEKAKSDVVPPPSGVIPAEAGRATEQQRRWRSAVIKVIITMAVVGILAGVAQIPAKNREAPPTQVPPVNVTVTPVVAEKEVKDAFDLPAVVEPNCTVTVAAEVGGRVESIPFKEGAIVRKGDVLLHINADLIKPQFDGAEAQYTRDQLELKRMTALVKDEATSRKDLDDATTRLAASKAQLDEIRARLDRTTIYAPAGGVLNSLPVDEGEYVQPGTPVAEIVDTATIKVVVDIPEPDIAYFQVGQAATIIADVKGSPHRLEGKITFISELASQQTRSTRTEITLDNRNGLLHSGRIVHVVLQRRLLKDAIFIPLLAVIPMESSKAVYVVEGDQAQRRTVELGIIRGDRVQVTNGLKAGERLITAGHRFVSPGQKVQVIEGNSN
jgi:membrane fusion protein (multidrug efflux system)